MSSKRKASAKTKPPSLDAALGSPPSSPNVVLHDDYSYSIYKSVGIKAATKDELGYPRRRLALPSLARHADGGIDVERSATQEAFILYMFSEAPGRIRALHEDVYPVLAEFLQDQRNWGLFDQTCWVGGELNVDWRHLVEPMPELDPVRRALLSWLGGRDLDNEWFLGFCLDLLQDRHYGNLTEVPSLEDLYWQIVAYHDGVAGYGRSWDVLNIPAISFDRASDFEFGDIKAAFLNWAAEYADSVLRAEHAALMKQRRNQIGFKKRSFDHYRWLVKRVWLGHQGERINIDEAARLAAAFPGQYVDPPEVAAIDAGVVTAGEYLGVDPSRGIPPTELEN